MFVIIKSIREHVSECRFYSRRLKSNIGKHSDELFGVVVCARKNNRKYYLYSHLNNEYRNK